MEMVKEGSGRKGKEMRVFWIFWCVFFIFNLLVYFNKLTIAKVEENFVYEKYAKNKSAKRTLNFEIWKLSVENIKLLNYLSYICFIINWIEISNK